MNRLTEWKDGIAVLKETELNDPCEFCYDSIQKLAHYEDLEEQGRLIVLPVATGEPIFEVQKGNVVQHSLSRNWRIVRYLDEGIFGEIAFTTKEEAEAKLAELKGE